MAQMTAVDVDGADLSLPAEGGGTVLRLPFPPRWRTPRACARRSSRRRGRGGYG